MLISFFFIKDSFSQKEDHIWLYNFSNTFFAEPGDVWGCSVIDFNTLPPSVYEDTEMTLSMKETFAVICDDNGSLNYYSNGQVIRDSLHLNISNGDTINYGPRWEVFIRRDGQDFETTGFRGVQEIGFITQPETDTLLVLYQNNNEFFEIGEDFNYHLLQAKIYESVVVEKDKLINDQIRVGGTLTACKHANGRDWWLLQFSENQVFNYLITPEGIVLDHTQTIPFELTIPFTGQSKFSPKGDRFAIHGVFDLNSDTGKGLMISDFDRSTGDLINPQLDILPSYDNLLSNGVEFSPSGELLYISTQTTIRQYDLLDNDVFSSMQIVAVNDSVQNCSIDVGSAVAFIGQMQLAPDNQIYISLTAQCNDVHIIRHPDVRGVGCEVEQNAIVLPTFVFGTIPNTNTYRLGPLDGSPADTLGIDNLPVSRFWYEQNSSDFLSVQLWDVSYFRPEQWQWSFGDGQTSTERHPLHSYESNGIYEVCLTVSNENSNDTSCETLFLGTSDTEDMESDISLSVFPNPTEGLTRFLLSGYLPQDGVLTLYDLQGRVVYTQQMRTGATVADLSGLDIGTYVYELRDGQQVIGGGKVVRI